MSTEVAMPDKDKKVTIVFVINGEDVTVEQNENAPLKAARDKALEQSGNTGRPFDEWEIRNEQGELLDPTAKIETFGFTDGVRLFLNLMVGAGG